MTTIMNLTPHAINIYVGEEPAFTIEPSGTIARVTQTREHVLDIELTGQSVPVMQSSFGEVTGVPDPAENTFYVVSLITAQALKALGRIDDILIVDATVRDEDGRIIGCRGFARV